MDHDRAAAPDRPDPAARPPAAPDAPRPWRERLAEIAVRPVDLSPHRLGRWLLAAVLVLLPSAVWGVATASATAALGPHVARYEVTLDHEVTVDLGPLGTLVIDSPLPLTLGGRVVVQEIPREVTSFEGAQTLEALGRDLEGYVQFFSAPSATLEDAVRALVVDAARRTLLASGLLVTVIWVGRRVLGDARRHELADALRPHRGTVAGAGALVLVLASTVTASDQRSASLDVARPASAVFDGTPLEGARITGRLAGVIDTYGGQVVQAYRDNERFYADATGGLEAAWQERAESDAVLEQIRRDSEDLVPGDGGQGDADEQEGASPTADEQAGEGDDGSAEPEPVVLLMVTDLHCNVGMAPVIGAAARLSGADVVLDGGDTTVNGTDVESYCVTAFDQALPGGVEVVVAGGNHDSRRTADQQRAAGAVVLDGETVEVAGVRILGDGDPRESRIGSGTSLTGDETVVETAVRIADTACADERGVDLLLIHDPRIGVDTLEQGCVPAQLSGHMHRREGPRPLGEGVRYVSASTAGAALGRPTVGPLSGIAEMTVLRFDPADRRLLDYRLIRVHPDARVDVGFAVDWPAQQEPDEDAPARPFL